MLRKKKKKDKNPNQLTTSVTKPQWPCCSAQGLGIWQTSQCIKDMALSPSRNHIQTGDVTRPCHCPACCHREAVRLLLVSLRCPSPSQLQHRIMPWSHPSQRAGEHVPAKRLLCSLFRDKKPLLTAPQMLGRGNQCINHDCSRGTARAEGHAGAADDAGTRRGHCKITTATLLRGEVPERKDFTHLLLKRAGGLQRFLWGSL